MQVIKDMCNFWSSLTKPIFALAPLSGITDSPFRRICKGFGADVVYSELSSAAAFAYQPETTLKSMRFDEVERPYVVQLFGGDPDHFAVAVRCVSREIKPDGIDINFGCPVPKVFKRGAGAALMTNLSLAREVIQSVIENTPLPVSIKTRISVKGVDLLSLLDYVSDLDIKALMIHGRSYAQGFTGPNDIETTRNARAHFKGVILANGGAKTAVHGLELLRQTEADGVGIGRGVLGNPWIFKHLKEARNGGYGGVRSITQSDDGKSVAVVPNEKPARQDVFSTALEHSRLLIAFKGRRGIVEMRKHLCWYLHQIPGAKALRQKAVKINSLDDITDLLSGEDVRN